MADPYEGQTASNAKGDKVVWKEGAWHSLSRAAAPAGAGGQTGTRPGADMRGRLALSLEPMIEAQKHMVEREKRGNPFNQHPIARALEAVPFDGGAAARIAGGDDYQSYEQAARTYEASIMPLFSGAAVSPSEAQRMIRADLPQMGDTTENLARKAKNREMRIRAAAKMMGESDPFGTELAGPSPVDTPAAATGRTLEASRYAPAGGKPKPVLQTSTEDLLAMRRAMRGQ
jgi:hypothetical protein